PQIVRQNERCVLCFSALVNQSFYLFPCEHHCHESCYQSLQLHKDEDQPIECALCGPDVIKNLASLLVPSQTAFSAQMGAWF
ncbi:hypothetical protein Ciccas_009325, partial [Cichlidogyrus casuarinus]